MGKLKVAVFNTQPPHLYFGGVERRIIEVAKNLSDKVDTTIYSGTKKGFHSATYVDGTVLVPCFSTDKFFPLDNWFFNQSISRIYNKVQADVYEAHAVSGYGFLKAVKKNKSSTPFVQVIHGVLADEYLQSRKSTSPTFRTKIADLLMWQLARTEAKLAKDATLIVTVSKYSLEKIVNLYRVNKEKIRVVPNGVDPQRFKPTEDYEKIRQEIGVNDKPCVLFVGRLIQRKGLPFLVEAAKDIIKECSETMFVIVGDGPLRGHLVAELEKTNLSRNFKFLGDVTDEMLPKLYNCCDVFALPSIQEGQGIALLEAQATAKPVVVFNVGAVSEAMLNGYSGLLVKPTDSGELGQAILRLLSDKQLRERMGARGREFVSKNYSWSICAEKMFNIYNEVR